MSYEGTTATKRYGHLAIELTPTVLEASVLWSPIGEITDINRDWNRTRISIEGTREMENVAEYHGMYEPTYTCEFKMTNAKCLYLAFGQATENSILNVDHFDHTIDGTSSTLPYHQIEVLDLVDAKSDFIEGCWVDSFTMSAAQNDVVNISMSGQGLGVRNDTQNTTILPNVTQTEQGVAQDAQYNGEPFRFQHGAISLYDSSAKVLDGILHSFELSVNNSFVRGPAFGGFEAGYHTLQKREITMSITIDIDDLTRPIVRNLVENETEFEITFTLTRTAGTDDMVFHFPTCKVFSHPLDYSDSIRTTLEVIVTNYDPATIPSPIGTLPSTGVGWAIDINDYIPAYKATRTSA